MSVAAQEGGDESVEHVREQLLAMVRLEREVDHLQTAMQCVESTAASLQASEAPEDVSGTVCQWPHFMWVWFQEPPNLMSDMESKMVSLLGEDVSFDPATHPCAQEFAQILTQGSEDVCEGEEEAMDKDVLVGKVRWL